MRHVAILAAIACSCAACGMIGPPPAELGQVEIRAAPDDPNCRVWTALAQINLRQESLVGRGCKTPDGGWQVTEGTPDNPRRFDQHVDAATASRFPWRSGPPVGVSTGRLVIYGISSGLAGGRN